MPAPHAGSKRPPPWLWIVGALVALVLAAWIALAVLFPPERVRSMVQVQLGNLFARQVRYRDARLGLWPPVRLSVLEPALAEPGGFTRGAAVRLRSLHLDLDPLALLGRKIQVRRLVLDGPELHLVLRPDGTTNFDNLMKSGPSRPGPAEKPMDFEVRELVIHDGRVLIDDLKASRRTALSIETKTGLAAEHGGTRFRTQGNTEVRDLAFGPLSATRNADLNQSLAKLTWKLEHQGKLDTEGKKLALERLALQTGRAEISVSGLVDELGPKPLLQLRTRGSGVDLGEVMGYLAAADAKALHGIDARGKLDFDLAIRGRLAPERLPAIVGALRIADAAFRYPGAPAGVEALSMTARFAPDSLGIGDLRARVSGQPVRAQLAVIRFTDPRVSFSVQGNVDLAAVAPLVAPKDTKLAGRAAVDVRGSGRAKDPGSIALAGSARLTDVSVASPTLPKKIEKVEGTIEFSPQQAKVRSLSARAGESSFTLDASVARPLALMATPGKVAPADVDFRLQSRYLDLAELLPATPGAPILPNATGGGTVSIGRLKNQKLDVSAVAARVSLEPGVVTVPEFSMKSYGGDTYGSARFDVRNPAVPAYSVKAVAESIEADAVLSAWTPARNLLHGALNSSLDLSGSGTKPSEVAKTLTAAGLAAIAQGTLGPGPTLDAIAEYVKIPGFKTLKIRDGQYPFRVEQGRVFFREVRFGGPTGDWRLAGSVGFDGTLDYAVSITLPRELASRLGAGAALATGALADEQGRLLLDLRVRGPAKKPQVSWDPSAMRERLAGRASTALEEQKDKLQHQLEDAARQRQMAAADSARRALDRARKALEDSLKRRAGEGLGDALRDMFGGGKKTAPAATPPPAPAASRAPADTTQKP